VEVLRIGDRAHEAHGAAEHALSLYERKGNLPEAARTRSLLDELGAAGSRHVRKAPDGAFRSA
jgi:hypothetical protein